MKSSKTCGLPKTSKMSDLETRPSYTIDSSTPITATFTDDLCFESKTSAMPLVKLADRTKARHNVEDFLKSIKREICIENTLGDSSKCNKAQ